MENENKQNQSNTSSSGNSNSGNSSNSGSNSNSANSGSSSNSGNNFGSSSGNSGNSSNSKSSSSSGSGSSSNQNKSSSGGEASVLTLLQPHDMSRTVESALHVFQGKHDKLPDLMQDLGNILLRATRRFTTTQLVIAAGALTVGAVLLAKYSEDIDFDFDE